MVVPVSACIRRGSNSIRINVAEHEFRICNGSNLRSSSASKHLDKNALLGNNSSISSADSLTSRREIVVTNSFEHGRPVGDKTLVFWHISKRVDHIVSKLNLDFLNRDSSIRKFLCSPRYLQEDGGSS